MRVLVAFDKFKDSLTAQAACATASAALRERHPDWAIDACPLSDGGEGFCEILTAAAGGRLASVRVTGPRATPVEAAIGLVPYDRVPPDARRFLPEPSVDDATAPSLALIDMASASGLALLEPAQRDPWQTTTLGTGELIRHAARHGATAILLGVGGSATHDLGLGALAALGLEFRTANGALVSPPLPARWPDIARISGGILASDLSPGPRAAAPSAGPALPPIRIACDVSNPLLGPRGAAATYGPQKGLRAADLPRLDHESARLGLMLCAYCRRPDSLLDTPGAGAAGGISFGLMAAAGAQLVPGFDLVSSWLELDARLAAADLVITGEGRFDDSSLDGKGPGAIVARAVALGKPVQVFAGAASVTRPPPKLAVHAITPAGMPLDEALRTAAGNLAAAIRSTL